MNTYCSEKYIIDDKIISFFTKKKMVGITAENISL
ncbi:tyrosine-type recombinase/integrase [Amedibacillus sp. YH-ame10]